MKINLVVKHLRIVVDKIEWIESFFKLFQSCLNAGQLLVWLKDMINAVSSCLVFNLSLLHVIHLSHLANRFLRLEGHLQKELMLEGIAVVAVSVHKCWDYFMGPELRGVTIRNFENVFSIYWQHFLRQHPILYLFRNDWTVIPVYHPEGWTLNITIVQFS